MTQNGTKLQSHYSSINGTPETSMDEIREEPVERLPPHDTGLVSYHVDYESFDQSEASVEEQVGHAIRYYESHDEYAPDNLTLTEVDSPEKAEIVIRRNEYIDGGSIMDHHSRRAELDGGQYRHLNVTIRTDLSGGETLGWHVGYWFGYLFTGADSQDDLPLPFRDADTYEDRVEWWG